MSTATAKNTTDQQWAEEQIEAVEATKEGVREFDASEAGARYLRVVGMTMWTNLGGHSLPNRGDDAE